MSVSSCNINSIHIFQDYYAGLNAANQIEYALCSVQCKVLILCFKIIGKKEFSFFVIFHFFFHEQSGTFSRDESLFSTVVCLRLLIFSFIEALSIGRHTRIRPIIKNNHESNYRSLILYAVI